MRVDDVLRRLGPLIPREVKEWKRSLPLVDRETRQVLEQHIVATAQDLLGDWEAKMLLPPPFRKLAEGPLRLGTVFYGRPLHPFGLKPGELLQGLGIYGRSGAGKTNVVFSLIRQLERKGIKFLFLDWKRTCRHLLPSLRRRVGVYTPGRLLSPFFFNPLIPPPGIELRTHITQLTDILGDAYTLGDGAKSLVQQALVQTYEEGKTWPSFETVLSALEGRDVKGRAIGWKATALRALQSIEFADSPGRAATDQEELVAGLLDQSTVIELDGLGQNSKNFLVPTLMRWLFQYRLQTPDREKLKLVIIVEEAHHLLYRSESRAKESVMDQMLRQCRELGIGIVVVDQHPHLISSAALGNAFASICLNLKDPADINRASALSGLREDEKRYLSMLPVGYGIVKLQDRWREPFLVRFDHESVDKGIVTDEVFRSFLKSGRALSRGVGPEYPDGARIRRVRLGDPVSGDGFMLTMDCLDHPADGVRSRYQRLGWSMARGNAVKNELLDAELLEASVVPLGRTRRLILRPTKEARRVLGLSDGATRESIQHEFWKHYWAEEFRRRGYQVEVEADRSGGRVDVLAWRPLEGDGGGEGDEERIGIEVETGKSDVVRNVANCLRSGFDRVVVVAVSEKALEKVEKELATKGLLVRGRVKIVGADAGG